MLFFVSLFPHGFCVSVYSGWAHLLSSSPLFRGEGSGGCAHPSFFWSAAILRLRSASLLCSPPHPANFPTSQQVGKPTSWQTPHLRPPRSPALIAVCNECTMQSLQTAITTQPTHPAPVTFIVHHTPLCAHPLLPHPAALTFSYPGVNQKPTPHTHPGTFSAARRCTRPPTLQVSNSPTSRQVEKPTSRKVGKSESWRIGKRPPPAPPPLRYRSHLIPPCLHPAPALAASFLSAPRR